MYEGSRVELKMSKVIIVDAILDDLTHVCKLLRYEAEEDYMRLQLESDALQDVPLDAKYNCNIITKTEVLTCSGMIKERFRTDEGNIIIFKIENGFYSTQRTKKK